MASHLGWQHNLIANFVPNIYDEMPSSRMTSVPRSVSASSNMVANALSCSMCSFKTFKIHSMKMHYAITHFKLEMLEQNSGKRRSCAVCQWCPPNIYSEELATDLIANHIAWQHNAILSCLPDIRASSPFLFIVHRRSFKGM